MIQASAVILVKNGERYLAECLKSLSVFSEVVVLNNQSTDGTVEIANGFPNVKIYNSDFLGFGKMKNLAASYASHDWVFIIDSDEIATDLLIDNIKSIDFSRSNYVYSIERDNHYKQKLIKGCGWNNDWQNRIYNKKHTSFNDAEVHENIISQPDTTTKKIVGKLNHYPFDSVRSLLDKLNQYSTLYAQQYFRRKSSSPIKAIYKGLFTFFRDFILERGLLYGYEGFLISACNGNGAFYKYLKLYEENNSLKVSLLITTYNRPDALELVLLSVINQTVLPDEVIVADDGSGVETKLMIEKYQGIFPVPLIHVWHEDVGFRLSGIRNRGILASSSPYILMIDGDMVLHQDFVMIQKSLAHKGTYYQGKRVLLSESRSKQSLISKKIVVNFFSSGIKNRFNSISNKWLAKVFSFHKNTITSVKGCSMAFWKEDVIKVNGFNEDFEGWGREDSEFVVRFLNAGFKRKNLVLGGVAYHLFHPESTRNSLTKNDEILENCISNKLISCANGISKYL